MPSSHHHQIAIDPERMILSMHSRAPSWDVLRYGCLITAASDIATTVDDATIMIGWLVMKRVSSVT